MRIVMIGAGNVATHICKTLASKDCTLVQVWSRSLKSASELASLTGCEPVTSFADIVRDADIYIISVVDSALDGVLHSCAQNAAMACLCILRALCQCRFLKVEPSIMG